MCLFLLSLTLMLPGLAHSGIPCYGCTKFRDDQRGMALKRKPVSSECTRPCRCPLQDLNCNYGVSRLRDGCGCCFICARQLGDLCSRKNLCEPTKGLFCDTTRYSAHGICRALNPKSCYINGTKYEDGARFKLGCSRLCTCQNGNYGCSDLCPQEHKRPSEQYCKNARLVAVRGACCKEWTCDAVNFTNKAPRHAELQSANLLFMSEESLKQYDKSNTSTCSDWSACSVTCGTGFSYKYDPDKCTEIQDRRVCYLRPCTSLPLQTYGKKKCTPTTRLPKKEHIVVNTTEGNVCRSLRKYRLKFCTTCKRSKCCYPWKEHTRMLEFKCDDNNYKYYRYAWTKRCRCAKKCPDNMKKLE